MSTLEQAAATSSWRGRHPGEKAVLSGGLLACAVALPPWPGAAAAAVAAVAVALLLARVAPRTLLRAVRGPVAFVVLGTLPLLVTVSTAGVGWAPGGAAQAGGLALRATAGLAATVLFAATTPLAEVVPRLERLGVPAAVVATAVLTYRMVGTLGVTAQAVHQAQAARLGHRTRRALLRSTAAQAATLFVLSLQRARRLQEGLALRAEPGASRVLLAERPLSRRFVAASLVLVVAVAAVGCRAWTW